MRKIAAIPAAHITGTGPTLALALALNNLAILGRRLWIQTAFLDEEGCKTFIGKYIILRIKALRTIAYTDVFIALIHCARASEIPS